MKYFKSIILISLVAAASLMLSSCHDDPTFDGDLIVGKWVSGTEYYRYDSDGTGATWDVADDVQEEEGQPYTWSFDETTSTLTLVHQMEMGGVIPKHYTITALDDSQLKYKDNYDREFTYNRVN